MYMRGKEQHDTKRRQADEKKSKKKKREGDQYGDPGHTAQEEISSFFLNPFSSLRQTSCERIICIETTTFFRFTELIQSDRVQKGSTVKDAQIRMARDGAGDGLCELFLKAVKRRSGMWFTCINYSDI